MATALNRGEMFAPETVTELFNKVGGKSSIVKLAGSMPIPFNGAEIFTFSMDDEASIVAENEAKTAGSAKLAPIKVVPIKLEYGARVSDEFKYGSEEKKLDILKDFTEGYARKIARALDIMAFHGVNPRSKNESTQVGTNCFDKAEGVTKVVYDSAKIEENIEDAIAACSENFDVTGMAMSKDFSSTLASLTVNGAKQYPELGWGANPGVVRGLPVDVNSTVSFDKSKDKAIVGDFANAFKWGFAKEIPLEVIEYGDPDGTGKDLKRYNNVYLRAETYVGWAILDPTAFARIEEADKSGDSVDEV